MRRTLLASLIPALLLPSAVAAAEPAEPRAIVSVDTSAVGESTDGGMTYLGGAIDGSVHVIGPLWLHARAAHTLAFLPEHDGTGYEIRGGAQLRHCRGRVCPFVGLDLGYQHLDVTEDHSASTVDALIIAPSAGLDVRIVGDLSLHTAITGRALVGGDDGWNRGVGFDLGLGYRF